MQVGDRQVRQQVRNLENGGESCIHELRYNRAGNKGKWAGIYRKGGQVRTGGGDIIDYTHSAGVWTMTEPPLPSTDGS